MVYVLNKDGKPLMPTSQHAYVRILLKEGRAHVKSLNPFTIRLDYETKDEVQPAILGIDPGRTNIGLCAVNEKGEPLFTAHVETRNKEVPKLMEKRKGFRQHHRRDGRRKKRQRRAKANNTVLKDGEVKRHLPSYGGDKAVKCKAIRNKEARYSNRKRKEGWLTPTANHLLETHVNAVRLVSKFLPVTKVVLELNKFAFMRLDDPGAEGTDFQKGPLCGYDGSVKAAVHDLQDGKCLLCGKPIEEYHHVRERRKNGSETPRNRVGLCRGCHRLVHTDERKAEELKTKAAGERKKYDALGVLNQIVPKLVQSLMENFDLSVTTGWKTKEFREEHGLSKDPHLDAYAIACTNLETDEVKAPETCYGIRQFRRHDRQACEREMLNRNYILDGKIVAQNRHKAVGQAADSLEEYVLKGGRTDNLKVRHPAKAMKDMDRFYPGCLQK